MTWDKCMWVRVWVSVFEKIRARPEKENRTCVPIVTTRLNFTDAAYTARVTRDGNVIGVCYYMT